MEPRDLFTRGSPRLGRHGGHAEPLYGPGGFGPAGVEEHGIGAAGFPRNLVRPASSAANIPEEGTGLRTPGPPLTRSGATGAKDRRTLRYGHVNHKETCRRGPGNRSASLVPVKP